MKAHSTKATSTNSLGRDLKASIVRSGLTQTEVANQLGVGFAHLNRVLNGRRYSRRLLSQVISLTRAHLDDNKSGAAT